MAGGPLHLIVRVRPDPARQAQAQALLAQMIEMSRLEVGCEAMDLVRPEDDLGTWLVLERWASRSAWEDHARGARNIRDGERLGELLAEPLTLEFFVRV